MVAVEDMERDRSWWQISASVAAGEPIAGMIVMGVQRLQEQRHLRLLRQAERGLQAGKHRGLHLAIASAGHGIAGTDNRRGDAGRLVELEGLSHAVEPRLAVRRIGQTAADRVGEPITVLVISTPCRPPRRALGALIAAVDEPISTYLSPASLRGDASQTSGPQTPSDAQSQLT